MDFTDIFMDIQQTLPEEITLPPPPYSNESDFKEKFTATYQSLMRSIHLRDRLLALVNSFFLGQLLNQLQTPGARIAYKKKMTVHYATMVENTFDIFEHCPIQIMRTTELNVQIIKKLKKNQVLELRDAITLQAGL